MHDSLLLTRLFSRHDYFAHQSTLICLSLETYTYILILKSFTISLSTIFKWLIVDLYRKTFCNQKCGWLIMHSSCRFASLVFNVMLYIIILINYLSFSLNVAENVYQRIFFDLWGRYLRVDLRIALNFIYGKKHV